MPEFRTEPLVVQSVSGLLPEGERDRRVALTSFASRSSEHRVPQREISCYECGKRCSVPAAALSAHCIHCHSHLNLADMEIKPGSHRLTVRTAGRVLVPAETELSAPLSIRCGELEIHGRITGSFFCTGRLTFASSLQVSGAVRAAELRVEKGARVTLQEGARVRTATVAGQLQGVLRARGVVRVLRTGLLEGDCAADQVVVEPGGRWLGQALS
ncbi:MAG: polymer-forming cytoskeletal protein [Akkermansia sp.]